MTNKTRYKGPYLSFREHRKRIHIAQALFSGYVTLEGAAWYLGLGKRGLTDWILKYKEEITVKEVREKAIKCDHCERWFFDRHGIMGHMVAHPGMRILHCLGCRVLLTPENRPYGKRGDKEAICGDCARKVNRRHYLRMKEKNTPEEIAKKKRKYYVNLKRQVLDAYGNACNCCGETIPDFLSIDHIANDGWQHRKTVKIWQFYSWLKKNDYPKDNFQLLCYNCNYAKGHHGSCPHTWEDQSLRE